MGYCVCENWALHSGILYQHLPSVKIVGFFSPHGAGSPSGKVLLLTAHMCYEGTKNAHELFCTNFLNTPKGPRHPGKIPGTSQIPLFETQGRQTFKGEHELFGHHPCAWKTPTPPGGLRTQKVNLCALFSCLSYEGQNISCS